MGKIIKNVYPRLILLIDLILITYYFVVFSMQFSYTQTKLAQLLTDKLSSDTGTEISLEKVRLDYFNRIVIENFYMEDQLKDTLLFTNEVDIGFNVKHLMNLKLKIQSLCVTNPYINLYKEDQDLNLKFIIDYFSPSDSTQNEVLVNLSLSHFEIINGRFSYHDHLAENLVKGFDKNHIDVTELNLYLSDLSIDSNDIDVTYAKISLNEGDFSISNMTSGIIINEERIELHDLHLQTENSELLGHIALQSENWSSYSDFIRSVEIQSRFLPSDLSISDLSYFVPDLAGLEDIPQFSGILTGTVDEFAGKDFELHLGNHTHALLDFKIKGLPNFEETFMHLNIYELISSKNGIEKIRIPPFDSKNHIKLPKNFSHLGRINFTGIISGFPSDLNIKGDLNTGIGRVKTDLNLKNDSLFQYAGSLQAIEFEAGKFFENEKYIGKVSLTAKINGKGLEKSNIAASIDGIIEHMEFNNYNYHNVKIAGDFKKEMFRGDVSVNDPNVQLKFIGSIDLSEENMQFNFMSEIENLYPRIVFGIDHIDSSAHISSTVNIDLSAKNIDNLIGRMELLNTVYIEKDQVINSDYFTFVSKREKEKKSISINSDILDFDLQGRYDMLDGFKTFKSLLSQYFPNTIEGEISVDKEFKFDLHLKDLSLVEKLLNPGIHIEPGSKVKGDFNSENNYLDLRAEIFGFTTGALSIDTSLVHIFTDDDQLKMDGRMSHYSLGKKTQERVIEISSIAEQNQIETELKSYGSGPLASNLFLHNYINDHNTYGFKFYNSSFRINDSIWTISDSNFVLYDSTSWLFQNLGVGRLDQKIELNGKISNNNGERIQLTLQNFNLNVLNPFIERLKLSFNGILNGNAVVRTVQEELLFESDLSFNDLEFNEKEIGNGHIKSIWDDTKKRLNVDGLIYLNKVDRLVLAGSYRTKKKKSPLHFDLKLEDLPLNVLEPLTQNIMSEFEGTGSGFLQLRGDLKSPELSGLFFVNDAKVKVDYTNVSYKLRNSLDNSKIIPVLLNQDSIIIPSFKANDDFGHSGIGSVTFIHDNFKKFETDLKVNADNLFVLNTRKKQNELYYGKVFVSGDISIWSEKDFSSIKMDIKTEDNTVFNLPLDESSEITENQFIVFELDEDEEIEENEVEKEDELNVEVEINLEATTGALARLVFDEVTGDVIEARGFGDLFISYTPENSLSMVGEYEIKSGSYVFTLQTVVNKQFVIESGSRIKWNGDPYSGEMDITTAYKTRARLYDILPEIDPDVNYKKRVPVDLRLKLTQSVESPIVGFEIFLPDSKESVRQQLNTELSNENCLNRQVFSLLILTTFTPCEAKAENQATTNVGKTTAYEAMSNQLSGWLSQISEDVDVGVNYSPEIEGEEYSPEQVEIAISTQLFNDRVVIDGNASSGNQSATTQNTNNWAGEFTVEYKIRPDGRLRVKAFNKVNDRYYIENDNLYIQGVGLKYSKDFGSTLPKAMRPKKVKVRKEKVDDSSK